MSRCLMLFCLVGMFSVALGCGAAPESPAKAEKPNTTKEKPVSPRVTAASQQGPAEVRPDEFASVEAAYQELERAIALPDGEEQNKAVIRCQNWLLSQKDQAIPASAERATNEDESLGMRLTACRILGLLGPGSADALQQVAQEAESSQLRRKAIDMLGRLTPPEPKTVEVLIALLDDPDSQIQWQAANSILQVGEPAKAASTKLGELRQNHPDEQVRVAAGEALKKVDPRKTFSD